MAKRKRERERKKTRRLWLDRTEASPGEAVRIYLGGLGGQTFKGFMVQARNIGGTIFLMPPAIR